MNILIVGGTMFLGRYLVRGLRERGHLVTMFNRGKSHPDLFPEVPRVIGDRRNEDDLDQREPPLRSRSDRAGGARRTPLPVHGQLRLLHPITFVKS